MVVGGTLVAAAVVVRQLVADDSIVLLGIELASIGPTTNSGTSLVGILHSTPARQ